MLPQRHRLRTPADFSAVTRGPGGTRAGSHLLVVHAKQTDSRAARPPRVGFVVSKAVGGAVIRNQVKRRLRGLIADRLGHIPAGVDVVVRAQAAAAGLSSQTLAVDLDRLLLKVLGEARLGGPRPRHSGAPCPGESAR